MRPVFADPKTDFVFKRIFGSEVHKPLLIELLNALLEFTGNHRDARCALTLAFREGYEEGLRQAREERWWREGRDEGWREAIRAFCQVFEIELDAEQEAVLAGMGGDELKELQARLLRERRWS